MPSEKAPPQTCSASIVRDSSQGVLYFASRSAGFAFVAASVAASVAESSALSMPGPSAYNNSS